MESLNSCLEIKSSKVCEISFAFSCYLLLIYYLYFLGKLPIFANSKIGIKNTAMNSPELWIAVFTLLILPIAYFRSIDVLKHTSWLSIIGTIAFMLAIIIQSSLTQNLKQNSTDALGDIPSYISDFFESFNMIVFAFICQINILAVYEEFGHRNKDKIKYVMRISLSLVSVFYMIIGTFGYLMFSKQDHKVYIIQSELDSDTNSIAMYIVRYI